MRLLCLLGVLASWPAWAAVHQVGEGAAHPTLAAALRVARDGDTIHLGPGSYFECGIVTQRNLVIEGEGEATVLTDRPCEGKALLVVRGDGLTVRSLVLARVRVPDRNGAGVRLEGQGLTLDRVRFDNNEVGVLAGQAGGGTVRIMDCAFVSGGVAGDRPTAAVMAGAVALLRIERSTFDRVKGAQVSSAAEVTEMVGNTVTLDGEPSATTPISGSGRLLMNGNTIRLVRPQPGRAAVAVATGEGVILQGNTLRNESGERAVLLLDWTTGTPRLQGNVVGAGDAEVSGEGLLRHRAGNLARGAMGEARQAAGEAKRMLKDALGR